MRRRWLGLVIVAVAVGLSIWAYPRLPDSVPSHWNMQGQVDDYSSRRFAAVGMPVALLVLMVVFHVLPRIDPKGRDYPKFQDTYWTLVNGVLALLLGLHVMVLAVGMGAGVNVRQAIGIGVGLLFMLIGNYLGRLQPNWFMGIRTPWTLSSETVWRKTHRTAAWLFVAGGLIVLLLGVVRPAIQMTLLAVTLAIAAGIPVVQSYVLWRRERIR